ncbi:phage tail protein [Francisella philomiragia]|uniref:phage tail-collar fiber domain-containing protein n=1 Tax=Francisella philomiragia TaxID=28110 RepID=UPI001C9DD595|nr:phage tail protein [Francisella philomiragia]MBY7733481.1 phage tail protein [Francisella philomiragia]
MSNTLTIPNSMLDKLANANINGDSIVISDYSVTDSSVNSEATVGNIIHSDTITSTQDDPNNINTIIVKVVIPSSVNSNNTVRKIYLYDQDGDVFGYGLVPPFTLSSNNNIEAELNFYVTNSNISTVTITTLSMTYVTQDMLADALDNIPDATETVKGVQQNATDEETQTEDLDNRTITPLKLGNYYKNKKATDAIVDGNIDDESFLTVNKVNRLLNNAGLIGSLLVDQTANRSAGVYSGTSITYTNNTGHLIWVLIRISATSPNFPSGYFYVDNKLISVMSTATSTSNTIIAPVSAGSEYRFDKLAATNLTKWYELI